MEPITIIMTLASGILIGWWGHTLTFKRDQATRDHNEAAARAERKRHFVAFLLKWEQIAERTPAEQTPNLYFGQAAELFRSEAAKVRGDFNDLTEFDRLDSALSRMNGDAIAGDGINTSRDKLANAIRNFLQFVRNV